MSKPILYLQSYRSAHVFFDLFLPHVFSHTYQLDESISNVVFFIFIQILKDTSVCKQWRT